MDISVDDSKEMCLKIEAINFHKSLSMNRVANGKLFLATKRVL
jgi:hypothetical protein